MCVSNHAIEQMAWDISKRIHDHSIYRVVRIDFTGGKSKDIQYTEENPFIINSGEDIPLITNLLLEGEDGTFYSVEPNLHGERFAKGEFSYTEYTAIQKEEKSKGLIYVSISIIAFLFVGWSMVEYLT
ncbi:hypothetical protein [Bacillus sp. PS06]|uniref:hypothetical protein n=1 Tax=Bacillus sp. PS06 TaxID=2764176 RepID=UPI0017841766|nr:hypothetical protein [Bacillus sp. PS06]MBD8071295.1 hypothetical protein [Bacillus sp. PS06]